MYLVSVHLLPYLEALCLWNRRACRCANFTQRDGTVLTVRWQCSPLHNLVALIFTVCTVSYVAAVCTCCITTTNVFPLTAMLNFIHRQKKMTRITCIECSAANVPPLAFLWTTVIIYSFSVCGHSQNAILGKSQGNRSLIPSYVDVYVFDLDSLATYTEYVRNVWGWKRSSCCSRMKKFTNMVKHSLRLGCLLASS